MGHHPGPEEVRISLASLRLPLVLLAMGIASGCNALKSRYAMSDPVYAEKYADGAERGDLLGKVKQACDARHVSGLGGWYVSGGSLYRPSTDQPLIGADVGFESYSNSWLSRRAGVGFYSTDDEGYLAMDAGLRAQLPTRVAPFVGLGTMLGASRTERLADGDGADNDEDGLYDEPGETESGIDRVLALVYPEAGVHAWLNGNWRLTGYGRYLLGEFGPDESNWLIGGQLIFTYRPK